MDNQADVFRDRPVTDTGTGPAPMRWWVMLLQVLAVMVAYLIASMLPVIPAMVKQVQNPESELVLTSGIALASVMASMVGALLLTWVFLKKEGRVAEVWSFAIPFTKNRTLALAGLGLVATFAIFAVGSIVLQAIGLPPPDASEVLAWVTESPLMFTLWVLGVAMFAAGLGEELLWRGFLMDRLNRVAGLRGRWTLILVIQAALFGLPHLYQGLGGVILTALIGLLFGVIRIMERGSLLAVVLAHAAYDTLAMSLAYGDALDWLGG